MRSKGFKLLVRVLSMDSSTPSLLRLDVSQLCLHLGDDCVTGVDCSDGRYSRHDGHRWSIRSCLCYWYLHRWWVSSRASLVSLFIYPVSQIRLSGFKPSVLIQMISEIRLAVMTPSAAT